MTMTFMEKAAAQAQNGRRLCVGLDPVVGKIPEGVDVVSFVNRIVEATASVAGAFKPNLGFFEEHLGGLEELLEIVRHIQGRYRDIPIIGDAKRGDIGKTNLGYIKELFDVFRFDAATVHPFLGGEALQGFLDRQDKGIIVLCRTSNPGAGEFQNLMCEVSSDPCGWAHRAPLYQAVAHRVSAHWNGNGNCGLVVGATYPKELAEVHAIAPGLFKLIPGVGTQEGDLEVSVRNALNLEALPDLVINVSSAVLYAYLQEQFQTDSAQFDQAAAKAAVFYDQQIRDVVDNLGRVA